MEKYLNQPQPNYGQSAIASSCDRCGSTYTNCPTMKYALCDKCINKLSAITSKNCRKMEK